MPRAATTLTVEDRDSGLTFNDLIALVEQARAAGATGTEPVRAVVKMNGRAKKLSIEVGRVADAP